MGLVMQASASQRIQSDCHSSQLLGILVAHPCLALEEVTIPKGSGGFTEMNSLVTGPLIAGVSF